MRVFDRVVEILTADPSLSNEQVATRIQEVSPGSATSAASVASAKSAAKKKGLLKPAMKQVSTVQPVVSVAPDGEVLEETFEDRSDRIRQRYNALARMSHRVAIGGLPAIIVSGPPGLGKSFTVEKTLRDEGLADTAIMTDTEKDELADEWEAWLTADETEKSLRDPEDQPPRMFDILCGSISQVGLYLALWNLRNGGVLVLDDCDDVFRDETCLNLLKAVLDSSPVRRVSYRKKAAWMDEYNVPTSFEFRGSVVFCTNLDFETAINKGSGMATHYSALIDRCLYLSLTMRTLDDYLTRLHHVAIEDGMLVNMGLTPEEADEVMVFILKYSTRFYSISLRLVHQIALCFVTDRENWQEDIIAAKMRTI